MRKNTARHWLHAILDLLPVLVIPIFALQVRSDNGFQPISIDIQETRSVDFNQLYKSNRPDIFNYDSVTRQTGITNSIGTFWASNWSDGFVQSNGRLVYPEHRYLVLTTYLGGNVGTNYFNFVNANTNLSYFSLDTDNHYEFITGSIYPAFKAVDSSVITDYTGYIFYLQIYDITQMYGDYAPYVTYESFINDFPDLNYSFVLSEDVLIDTFVTTLDDTDVGSQMVYTLYRVVDNYFNMGDVFNMTNVYQWFSLNIFNGSIPLSIYIVWNIVLYEFVMDLMFLLYGLFMWFIDMLKRLIEKPIDSIK